jgi:ACR3 family arsenite transporter
MGLFERYLTVWVGLGILAGVGLGLFAPGAFQAIAGLEFAQVNLVVAVFIWVMIYPMMIQIDWHAVKDVGRKPQGLILTLVVNWLIKPFTMAALGVLFFQHLFAPWVDPQSASEYIAGMILLGVAPCTAMVFVWSQLVKGDPNYTLVQVSVNDLIMVFAFAPIAAFLLGVTDLTCRGRPAAVDGAVRGAARCWPGWRRGMCWSGARRRRWPSSSAASSPGPIVGLIATVVLLFGFQAHPSWKSRW